jgi:NAD(P)-dependent dehydrogenase (short-subunit alcohol dehydrogenase family)
MSQRWLITGSTRGIGRALAGAVLDAGHRLVATAREPACLSGLVDRYGDAVRIASLDVTDQAAAEAAVRVAVDSFGGLDVLVNNAGYGNVNSVEDTALDDFREQIETNLFGTIIVTKAAIPVMREQRRGHIIQFSSVGGRIGAQAARPTRQPNGESKGSPRRLPARWNSWVSGSRSSSPAASERISQDRRRHSRKDARNTTESSARRHGCSAAMMAGSPATPRGPHRPS